MGVEFNSLVRNAGELAKGLPSNSGALAWANLVPVTTMPSGDGIYAAGFGREAGAVKNYQFGWPSLKLYPYCEDNNGGFYMRVWGWEVFRPATMPAKVPRSETWFPTLLAELSCQTGNLTGPPARRTDIDPTIDNVMLASEYFAEQIDVVRGNAVVSTFQVGDGLVAKAIVDLGGVQLFQFDFSQDMQAPFGMNCFFGFA